MSFLPLVYVCPMCGDLVVEKPTPGEHDGMVCGGPFGHIVIERPPAARDLLVGFDLRPQT